MAGAASFWPTKVRRFRPLLFLIVCSLSAQPTLSILKPLPMKRFFFALCCMAALTVGAQTTPTPMPNQIVEALRVSQLKDLTPAQKPRVTKLALTGTLTARGNSDFRQLRDLCPQLRELDLSQADVTEIPDNAFLGCSNLRKIILPTKLRKIGYQAFLGCRGLTSISFPAGLEEVGSGAFNGCTRLREVHFAGAQPKVVGFAAFNGVPAPNLPTETDALREKVRTEKYSLVPLPAQLEERAGAPFEVARIGRIEAAPALHNEAGVARRVLRERTGVSVLRGGAALQLSVDTVAVSNAEGYTLTVDKKGIRIVGGSPAGVYYGLMTLDQLLAAQPTQLAPVFIADAPRTSVRELMVDPCRTFIPFARLKQIVTEMARYKFNALHLHLVDDQAWRIEIKKYPRLVAESSTRPAMDDMLYSSPGFYTQAEMKELVAFAAAHHVMVIPEIEMPGHEVAAIHAYPELTPGAKKVPIRTTCGVSNELLNPASEFTYQFLFDVFDELAEVFPAPYVHLGGDEAGMPPLDCWTNDSSCNALKDRLGITSRDRSENWRLQKYLFDRVIEHLRDKLGKTPMFWYETDFKEIQPGCVTFAWRHGLTAKALEAAERNNVKVMLCPGEHCYLDYPMAGGDLPEVNWGMPVTSLKQTYALDPAWGRGKEFEDKYMFGVTGTLWSECMPRPERIFYMAFPRAWALAEAGWTPQNRRDYTDFLRRLRLVMADYQLRGLPASNKF